MSWRNNRAVVLALLCGCLACSGGSPAPQASPAPDDARSDTSLPRESDASGETRERSTWLEHQVRLDPHNHELRLLLAETYLHEGRVDQAVALSRKLATSTRPPAGTRALLAKSLYGAALSSTKDTPAFLAVLAEADSLAAASGISASVDTFRRQTAERRADGLRTRHAAAALRYYDISSSVTARWKAIGLLLQEKRITEAMTRVRSIMMARPTALDSLEAIRIGMRIDPELAGFWAAKHHPDVIETEQAKRTGGNRETQAVLVAFLRGATRADSAHAPALLDELLRTGRMTEALVLLDRTALMGTGQWDDRRFKNILLDAALDSGRKEKALSILLTIDDESRESCRDRAETAARMLMGAGNLDGVIALANRFEFSRALDETIASQLYRRGRAADALRFDGERGEIKAAAAFQRGDTAEAVRELMHLRHAGRITTEQLVLLRTCVPDGGLRRILSLSLSLRGRAPANALDLRAMTSPMARIILADPGRTSASAEIIADAYLDLDLPARARNHLLAELRRAPANRALLPRLVRASRLAGDTTTAFAHVQGALQSEPDAADLNIIAFERDKRWGDRGSMIARLERVRTLPGISERPDILQLVHEELPKAYTAEAASQFKNRNYALDCLHKARELDKNDPAIPFNIAMIHSLNGEVDTALSSIEDCFRISETDIDALILAASLYKRKGRNAEAATAYQKAIDHGAGLNVRHDLALLLQNQGETSGAYVAAGEARRLDPENARIARTYGVLAAQLEKWSDALKPLRESVDAFPHDREAQYQLARTFVECGKIEEGKKIAALLTVPAERVEISARADLRTGRAMAAVTALRPLARNARMRELFTRALAEAADQMLANGKLAEARSLWREWLAFDSSAATPRTLLAAAAPASGIPANSGAPSSPTPGLVAARVPQPAESSVTGPASRTRRDTHPKVLAVVARQAESVPIPSMRNAAEAMRAGKFSAAESLVRKIIAGDRSNATAWNLLGLSLSRQGRRDDAVSAFRESLKLRPDQPEVRSAIEEMEKTTG